MGGDGGIVEVDEAFIGARKAWKFAKAAATRTPFLTLVERRARPLVPCRDATKEEIVPIVRDNIARESHLMTDEAAAMTKLGRGVCEARRGRPFARGIRLR